MYYEAHVSYLVLDLNDLIEKYDKTAVAILGDPAMQSTMRPAIVDVLWVHRQRLIWAWEDLTGEDYTRPENF